MNSFPNENIVFIDKINAESIGLIYNNDCIEVLKNIPDKSIDCIFADPPYFMQSTNKVLQRADGTGEFKGCDDVWDKFNSYSEYDLFTYNWLKEAKRILKDDGSLWVMGSFQNIFRIGYILQNLDFWILNDIIWNKTNPTPNMAGTRFCNAHETLIWCSKSQKSKFTFNYKTMKYLNDNKQDKSVWTLGIAQGNERLKNDAGKKLHTTQKPKSLLKKVILSSTKPNDIILDPFFGTGTTGAVAKMYGRKYIGIEKEQPYILGSIERLKNIKNNSDKISNLELEIKPPKVSIQTLIKNNYLIANEEFFDKNGYLKCILLEDGKVKDVLSNEILSIHKMSAKFLNKANNNGWSYFYIKRNNKLVLIDELRYEANDNLI